VSVIAAELDQIATAADAALPDNREAPFPGDLPSHGEARL
jgi:hypothetical protein